MTVRDWRRRNRDEDQDRPGDGYHRVVVIGPEGDPSYLTVEPDGAGTLTSTFRSRAGRWADPGQALAAAERHRRRRPADRVFVVAPECLAILHWDRRFQHNPKSVSPEGEGEDR